MANADHTVRVYEDLADWYDRNNQAKLRDWFLVLAADAALTAGRAAEAERLRIRLLHVNPHHLLKPFTSFAEALQSPDVQGYVADLRRTYSPQVAENLLASQRGAEGGRRPVEEPVPPPAKAAPMPLLFEDPFAEAGPEPQVFKLEPVAEEPKAKPAALPRQAPPPRAPVRPDPVPAPAPAPRSPPPPRARPPQPVPPARLPVLAPQPRQAALPAPSARASELDDADAAAGAWVSSVLFVVVLAASLALAVYAFARPFLPPSWLP